VAPSILGRTWVQLLLLVAVCGLLFFSNLDKRTLWPPDEPRYFGVAKETLDHGDWILLHKDGQVYTDKPPLFFWSVALSSVLWQRFDVFSARFPSALFATLSVILTFLLGRTLFGAGAGFIAGLVVATTPQFAWLASRVNIDSTLTCFITLALFSFVSWQHGRRAVSPRGRQNVLLLGFYGGMALATLTKGPVGFILPLIVCATYIMLRRDWSAFREMRPAAGGALFIAIVLLWYVPAALQGGESFLRETLLRHSVQRFAQGMDHSAPSYFYFERFPPGFAPWVLFLPAAIFLALSRRKSGEREQLIFPFLWFAAIFVFFSISTEKRDLYLVPLLPAAALLVGKALHDFAMEQMDRPCRLLILIPGALIGFFFALAGILFVWLGIKGFSETLPHVTALGLLTAGCGAALLAFGAFRRYLAAFLILVLLVGGIFFYAQRYLFSGVEDIKALRNAIKQVGADIGLSKRPDTQPVKQAPFRQ
jgi:4-amino-4-deoxy-L-arabinose transferase-like glycosyltransferase